MANLLFSKLQVMIEEKQIMAPRILNSQNTTLKDTQTERKREGKRGERTEKKK
jgi:hypothetical protein